VEPKQFRKACGKFVTGVTIVTTRGADGAPHGMTANSFTSISLDPPLVLFCAHRKIRLLEHFLQGGYFGVNILSEHQQELSNRFAKAGINRFAGVEWYEGKTGVPLLPGVLATLECRLDQTSEAGDHQILIGEAQYLGFREGTPLAYFGGGYSEVIPADARSRLHRDVFIEFL
jgi:flavin reductase (DIM6/NTAB) family NADH-FMN oxidoreductase RutF